MIKKRLLLLIVLVTFGALTAFFLIRKKETADSKEVEQYFVCPDGSHHGPGIPSEGVEAWCRSKGYGSELENDNWQQGVVTYVDLEGGFYGIITTEGKKLDPTNLPERFREDGLRVHFQAREEKEGAVGIRMWGTILELEDIKKTE